MPEGAAWSPLDFETPVDLYIPKNIEVADTIKPWIITQKRHLTIYRSVEHVTH